MKSAQIQPAPQARTYINEIRVKAFAELVSVHQINDMEGNLGLVLHVCVFVCEHVTGAQVSTQANCFCENSENKIVMTVQKRSVNVR